jgi:hypothetical protein
MMAELQAPPLFVPSPAPRRALAEINSSPAPRRKSISSSSPNAGRRLLHIPKAGETDEESDEEVFFGAVSEAELKKAARLKHRRRTAIHNATVRPSDVFC